VQFVAALRSVRGLANPGLPDSALQVRADGVDLFAGVGSAAAVRRLRDREIGFPWRVVPLIQRAATRVRRALGQAIDGVVTGQAGTFLHTTVLGERRNTDATVEDGFRAAGATHVLSVSGLHLAAVAVVFFSGVRWALVAVPRLPLWMEPRATAALAAIPAIAFYTLVTGSAIATVRSAIMMVVGLVGIALGRRNTPVVAIAAAVLFMLGWSPLVILDISFQLSAVSVLALAVLVPRLVPRDRPSETRAATAIRGWLVRPGRWIGGLAAASLAAGLTTAPIVAHHFGEVTPAAPLGNLVLVPLVEFVLVPFGLVGATVGATLGKPFGLPMLSVAGWASRAALWLAERFRGHAPVWLTRSPNVFETVTLCLGAACTLSVLRRRPDGSRSRPLTVCAALLVAAATCSSVVREMQRRWSRNLVVTFLDIGQGDAAVVQIPGGGTVLIDGGGTYDGSFDPGARVVEPFLRAHGITHLDTVALSHPHPDHLGGLHRIVARFPVHSLWTSGDDGHNPDYARFLAEARARGIPTPVPAHWEINGAVIEPLGPFVAQRTPDGRAEEHIGAPEGTTVNDASLILRVAFGGRAVLFTGDIEANGEGELAGRTSVGQSVASDVLKVPHHGSRTSSSAELLQAVHPEMAIISLGWRNRFHFPRPEVVERYQARNIRVLRTDLDGAVTVSIATDGGLQTTCERGCR
jgi:competence protein ComEC